MTTTPKQIRADRAMLCRQTDLVEKSGVLLVSIKNIERGATDPRARTLQVIEDAFEAAGLRFAGPGEDSLGGGHGVRLK